MPILFFYNTVNTFGMWWFVIRLNVREKRLIQKSASTWKSESRCQLPGSSALNTCTQIMSNFISYNWIEKKRPYNKIIHFTISSCLTKYKTYLTNKGKKLLHDLSIVCYSIYTKAEDDVMEFSDISKVTVSEVTNILLESYYHTQ